MAIDDTSVINSALILIGEKKISSASSSSAKAALARAVLEDAKHEELSNGVDWRFATVVASELSLSDFDPPTGWTAMFDLPAGLGIERILGPVNQAGENLTVTCKQAVFINGNREYNVLLANQDTMFIDYIRFRDLPATWPGYFRVCVKYNVAIGLCEDRSGDKGSYDRLSYKLNGKNGLRIKAKAINNRLNWQAQANGVDINKGNQDVLASAYSGQYPSNSHGTDFYRSFYE